MPRKILKGKVISDKNEKTIVVKKNTMLMMKKICLKLVTPYKLKSQNLIQKINDLKY